jgi:two-component system, OmpR family, sensor kinase
VRAAEVAAAVRRDPSLPLVAREDGVAQLLRPDGSLEAGRGPPVLTPAEIARAPLVLERPVAGIDAETRLVARPVTTPTGRRVLVVGMSLEDRDEALESVLASFLIAGAVALVLAGALGYGLATLGLAPVEAMRRRATAVSPAGDDRLPLPAADDEIRRLGETLNAMLERLQGAFARERRFVADASHELRTPLSVLKAELETTLRRDDLAPDAREALTAALAEADHLAQLAEDLLLIARSGDGGPPVRAEPVRVDELLGHARDRFVDRAAAEGRTIVVTAPDGLVAWLDPLRARQALGNLLDNALRHGAGAIELEAGERGDALELEVRDEGPGFPAGLSDRAFERFARGEPAGARSGAGLGLAIVRAIAEAHGGTAEIITGSGGATVRLRLPFSHAGSAPSQAPAGASKP